jgi:predicted GNAT family acetyltransferase
MNDSTSTAVHHNTAQQRFEATVEGHVNVADYRMSNGVMLLTHTHVHPDLQGRGIAASLIEAAMAFAREEGLKIDPLCTYARAYMQKHPETQSLHV